MRIDFLIPTKGRHAALRRSLPRLVRAAQRLDAALRLDAAQRLDVAARPEAHDRSAALCADTTGIILCDQSPEPFPDAGPWTLLHRPDLSGLPAARNVLMAHSRADVVCLLDDDTDVAADFAVVLRHLAMSEPAVIAWGPVVETRSRLVRRAHRLGQLGGFRDPRRLTARRVDAPTWALFGCCFAVRRAVAQRVGFDARLPGYALGEDLDFFARLRRANAGEVRFVRALRAIHRRDGHDRADPVRRGRSKGMFLRWWAARHGGADPAAPLHFLLALAGAALGRGQEPAATRAVLAGALR